MGKFDYKADVKSNRDCMDCLGKLQETLADPEIAATDEDVEMLVPLVLSLLRLSKIITRNNPLYVRLNECARREREISDVCGGILELY